MDTLRLFIHSPKTAGTSFISVLEKQIYFSRFERINPTRKIHPKKFLESCSELIQSITENKFSNIEMIGGHFAYGIHRSVKAETEYLTILRNPVDRVLSEYFYMKQKGFYHQNLIHSEKLDIKDYLFHPETFYLNNLQTRLISGISYDEGDNITEHHYQTALKHLKDFLVVGLTEQLSKTLALCYLKLSWDRLPVLSRSNVNKEKPAVELLSTDTIDRIRERERFDIRLYKEAETIFEDQISIYKSEIDELSDRISNPSVFNMIYTYLRAKSERFKKVI